MSAAASVPAVPARDAKVRVTVRTIAGTVPCMGRAFTATPVMLDASPADVRDLIAHSDRLIITWPEGYVLPNGVDPSKAKVAVVAEAVLTSADRVAIAEDRLEKALAHILELERGLSTVTSDRDATIGALHRELAELREQHTQVTLAAQAAAGSVGADGQALAEAIETHRADREALESRHRAALDTLRAELQPALDAALADVDRLKADNDRLTAQLDAATAPKGKASAKSQPASAPATTPA